MAKALTVEQVAEYLQVSPYTVRAWIRRGKIPGRKIGRVYRVLDSDVENVVGAPVPTIETETPVGGVRRSAYGFLSGGVRTVNDFLMDKRADIEREDGRRAT